MIILELTTEVNASIEDCFDAARDITIHENTVWRHTKEKAIAGRVSGKIENGEFVTFQATHFGIKQKLTSKVVKFQSPEYFVDEMVDGVFKTLRHEHHFEKKSMSSTLMKDILHFEAPFGILGWLAERLVLKSYMMNFLKYRGEQLKFILEERKAKTYY